MITSRFLQKLILALIFLWAFAAKAQTTCSPTNPCVQFPLNNTIPLPDMTILWACQGSACTQAALTLAQNGQNPTNLCPTNPSVWHCFSFSQTKTPQLYNDPEPWGTLMNYSTQGVAFGGVLANSQIVTFQVPQAETSPSIGVPTIVTSGTAGPQ